MAHIKDHWDCARRRMRLAQGVRGKAHEHLATARAMIERMGYHRRDKEVNELAAHLG